MENMWIFGLLGALSLFMSVVCHMRIAKAETDPYPTRDAFGLKVERFAFAFFALLFFALFLLR